MARFDVYQIANKDFVIDCQADLLSYLKTRFVVPLIPPGEGPTPISRLNPSLKVNGELFIFYADLAATIPARELSKRVASLADQDISVLTALDMLISGN
jgi:toxin CcdB